MAARKKPRSPARRSSRHTTRRVTRKKKAARRPRRWSARVTRTSHAMDTKPGIFKSSDPDRIAGSLLRSARRSKTRKTTPYQSAMSLLNFYENRGGKNLGKGKKRVLERAKDSLRERAGKAKGKKKTRTRSRRRSRR